MSTPFQNRLVGTVIVAAAIIIFLPDILDGEKETNQADFEAIPQAPAFQPKHAVKPFPEDKLNDIPKESLVDEQANDEAYQASLIANNAPNKETSSENVVIDPLEQTSAAKQAENKDTSTQNKVTKPVDNKAPVVTRNAWVIHLGSFKHKKNVDQLMKTLKTAGYTAFTQPIKTKKGALTKVIVGPSLNKAELEKNISKLKELTKVQGKLARFKVTK